jgi:membrane protein YdbS with pleckstrin-like domain
LPGESNGESLFNVCGARQWSPCNATSKNCCFARTCSGAHHNNAYWGSHCFALLCIEASKHGISRVAGFCLRLVQECHALKLGGCTLSSMPFPRRLLNDYENIVLDLHPHWWYFGSSVSTLLGSMFLTLMLRAQMPSGFFRDAIGYLGMAAIIVSAAWVLVQLIKWRTTYFVVTSHRLIYRQGVVSRDGVEIPLERVNNVNFSQSVLERMLGVGDLLIESGGQEGQQTFTDIAQPERVQNIIHSTIQARGGIRSEATPGSSSIAGELERLEALRDRGTITDDEFLEQKRRLLN